MQISNAPSQDFYQTSEVLTTGGSPVSINPNVYHTKIVSGGTAGLEIVSFDDWDANHASIPHLITFQTQTNGADRIQLYGNSDNSNPILVSGFGPLGVFLQSEEMQLNAEGDGYSLSWNGAAEGPAWALATTLGTPTTAYPNEQETNWSISKGPSVMRQQTDNTFILVPDTGNPFYEDTYVSSTSIGSPTDIPFNSYAVGIISSGSAGPEYIKMLGPNSDNLQSTGIKRQVYFKTRTNPADTINFTNLSSTLRNADGSNFTSVVLSSQGDQVNAHWDNIWIADPPTSPVVTPLLRVPLLGTFSPYNVTQNTGATYNVSVSQNYFTFKALSGGATFNVPAGTQSGNEFTFMVAVGGGTGITVQMPASTVCAGPGGVNTSSAGTLTSTDSGASVTIRDIESSAYQITAITGLWTLA